MNPRQDKRFCGATAQYFRLGRRLSIGRIGGGRAKRAAAAFPTRTTPRPVKSDLDGADLLAGRQLCTPLPPAYKSICHVMPARSEGGARLFGAPVLALPSRALGLAPARPVRQFSGKFRTVWRRRRRPLHRPPPPAQTCWRRAKIAAAAAAAARRGPARFASTQE